VVAAVEPEVGERHDVDARGDRAAFSSTKNVAMTARTRGSSAMPDVTTPPGVRYGRSRSARACAG
jgi:hypothetical protein